MGKKSRRQRESGGAATGFLKPHKRFEKDHWRHKDGTSVTNEDRKGCIWRMRFSNPAGWQCEKLNGKSICPLWLLENCQGRAQRD